MKIVWLAVATFVALVAIKDHVEVPMLFFAWLGTVWYMGRNR
jgi:hypothetical protein